MICLDTNVVVALLTGRKATSRRRYDAVRRAGEPLALSSIVLFELRFGAEKSARPDRNHKTLDAFLADGAAILDFDSEDAAEAGAIRAALEAKGRPIGPYDTLIAAQARRRGATLVTSNRAEFEGVPGLEVVDWEDGAQSGASK